MGGSAVPTEGALVIHPPSLCCQGHRELLLNPRQVLLRELRFLAQVLETRRDSQSIGASSRAAVLPLDFLLEALLSAQELLRELS